MKRGSLLCFFEVTEMLMPVTLLIDAKLQRDGALTANAERAGYG